MCTAISFSCGDHYFGRNLDLEFSYNESIVISPRKFPFSFRQVDRITEHYAIIGIGIVEEGYPLYFDATNEYGLSMAGLNFPGNAVFHSFRHGYDNITPFELIPWVLSQCKTTSDAVNRIESINLINENFNENFPLSPLHWIVDDRNSCIILESTHKGMQIYENPVGVLTNNPEFPHHMWNLQNYMHLSAEDQRNFIAPEIEFAPYSRGMGAIGLPGDLSSASRFVRAVFTKNNSIRPKSEEERVGQYFHILDSVSQTEGCCITPHGREKTVYSSCCNTDLLTYYYCTYTNRQITAVRLLPELMEGDQLTCYPLLTKQKILYMN